MQRIFSCSRLLGLSLFALSCVSAQSGNAGEHPTVEPLVHVTNHSRLPRTLTCLRVPNPSELPDTWYRNDECDTWISINPTNRDNMIIAAQQDDLEPALPLSAIFLYTLDGGKTWSESNLVLSRCQGATNPCANDDFESGYWPTVAFAEDGTAYALSSSYNYFENSDEGNIVAKSTDGGASWIRVTAAHRDDGTLNFLNFPSIATNPFHTDTVYVLSCDNPCGAITASGTQTITFQKSLNGGSSWSHPATIAQFGTPESDCFPTPFFPVLKVLSDRHKTLVAGVMLQGDGTDDVIVLRSRNDGETWKQYTVASNIPQVLPVDPGLDIQVGEFTTKDIAISRHNKRVYMVYTDPQFNPTGKAGCVIKMSKDGGKHWSEPRPINPTTLDVQTFLPSVSVAEDGTVGVLFYDFRHFSPSDHELKTDVWVSFFDKDLKHFKGEVRLTPESFDTRQAIRGFENNVFYLSSYVKLKADENDFVATFAVTNRPFGLPPSDGVTGEFEFDPRDRQDIVFVRIKR